MGRHVFYTKVTPLPSNVPRLLALDLLHSHDEFIRLNPLVTDVKPIDAPRSAEGDEYFSNWYEISEIMKVTGVKVKYDFKGCFHNQSWGMQSHVFAPMGIEFRNKYRIGGNQPGEPREDRELGVNTPQDGLYLREDISFTCNALMANFVKKGFQDASQVMIDRMKRKAELLDEGRLHAMFEHGTLKTSKPRQSAPPPAMNGEVTVPSPTSGSAPGSPPPPQQRFDSPFPPPNEQFQSGYQNYGALVGRHTSHSARESFVPLQYQDSDMRLSAPPPGRPKQGEFTSELPGSYYHPQQTSQVSSPPLKPSGPMAFRSELPGDSTYQPGSTPPSNAVQYPRLSPQPSPRLPLPTQSDPRMSSVTTSSTRSSGYQITNPDAPSQRSSTNAPERLSGMRNDAGVDENQYRNSQARPASSNYGSEPDLQRMSNLSLQPNGPASDRDGLPSQRPSVAPQTQKCPVCQVFEGDEPAVSHHITLSHNMQ